MSVIVKILKRFLYEFDFFKETFAFRLREDRTKNSTCLGQLCSLIIFAILLIVFTRSDMISKKNPSVLAQTIQTDEFPKLSLNSSNFQLVFQIYDIFLKGHEIDPSIFNVFITEVRYFPGENGEILLKRTPKKFSKCANSSNNLYCMQEDVEIEGYPILTEKSSFLTIQVSLCNQSNLDENCSDSQKITNFFLNKGFMVSYLSSNFEYENYANPIYFSRKAENMWLDAKTSKFLSIHLKKTWFFDDSSAFFDKPDISESFCRDFTVFDYTNTDNIEVNKVNSENFAYLAQIYVFSSYNVQKNRRTYQKMEQVLANLSGFFNLLFLSCFSIVSLQNSLDICEFILGNVREWEKPSGKDDIFSEKHQKIEKKEEKIIKNEEKIVKHDEKFMSFMQNKQKIGSFLKIYSVFTEK